MKQTQGTRVTNKRPLARGIAMGFGRSRLRHGALLTAAGTASAADVRDSEVDRAVTRGLDWLVAH